MPGTETASAAVGGRKQTVLLLLVGAVAYLFSSGRWNVPVMAWVWPLCFLAVSRKGPGARGLILSCLLMMGLSIVKWYGLADLAIGINLLTGAGLGLLSGIPFLIDRFFYKKISGFKATLLLPLAFVTVEVLMQLTPCGMVGSIAATQTGFDPLVQIASVFGAYGITFLVTWFAPVCLYVTDHWQGSGRGCKAAVLYPVVLATCLCFGGLRLAFANTTAPNVTLAVTTGPYVGDFMAGDLDELTLDESIASVQRSVTTAAGGHADLLLYCEEAFAVKDTDEAAFLQAVQAAAKENDIFVLIALEVDDTDNSQSGLADNVEFLIDNSGGVVWEYHKTHLVAIMETGLYTASDGVIPNETVTLPGGTEVKLASVICMDSDFPGFIRSGLDSDTQILLIPTWDWAAIRAYHTKWVELRAVENGVSLLRSAMDGVSTATDPYGRVVMRSDTAGSGYETVVFAQVPARSVPTVYHAAGAVIDGCYVAGLAALLAYGLIMEKRRKKQAAAPD